MSSQTVSVVEPDKGGKRGGGMWILFVKAKKYRLVRLNTCTGLSTSYTIFLLLLYVWTGEQYLIFYLGGKSLKVLILVGGFVLFFLDI